MCLKSTSLSSFIVTLITRVFYSLMYWLYMCLEVTVMASFIVTLITEVFETLMYWHCMSLEVFLQSKIWVTLITRVFYSLTLILKEFWFHTTLMRNILQLVFLTKVLWIQNQYQKQTTQRNWVNKYYCLDSEKRTPPLKIILALKLSRWLTLFAGNCNNYDFSSGQWTSRGGPMSSFRQSGQLVNVGSYIMAVGGVGQSGQLNTQVELFDPR